MRKFRFIKRVNGVVNYVRVRMIERLGGMDLGEVRVMREQGVAIGLHAGAMAVREYLRALYGLDAERWCKEAWKFAEGFCRAAECGLEDMELECGMEVVHVRETDVPGHGQTGTAAEDAGRETASPEHGDVDRETAMTEHGIAYRKAEMPGR